MINVITRSRFLPAGTPEKHLDALLSTFTTSFIVLIYHDINIISSSQLLNPEDSKISSWSLWDHILIQIILMSILHHHIAQPCTCHSSAFVIIKEKGKCFGITIYQNLYIEITKTIILIISLRHTQHTGNKLIWYPFIVQLYTFFYFIDQV